MLKTTTMTKTMMTLIEIVIWCAYDRVFDVTAMRVMSPLKMTRTKMKIVDVLLPLVAYRIWNDFHFFGPALIDGHDHSMVFVCPMLTVDPKLMVAIQLLMMHRANEFDLNFNLFQTKKKWKKMIVPEISFNSFSLVNLNHLKSILKMTKNQCDSFFLVHFCFFSTFFLNLKYSFVDSSKVHIFFGH